MIRQKDKGESNAIRRNVWPATGSSILEQMNSTFRSTFEFVQAHISKLNLGRVIFKLV